MLLTSQVISIIALVLAIGAMLITAALAYTKAKLLMASLIWSLLFFFVFVIEQQGEKHDGTSSSTRAVQCTDNCTDH